MRAQAAAYASQAGKTFIPVHHAAGQSQRTGGHAATGSGAGPTASQGGAGGGGRGGWIHVSDARRPPDFGRIADPDDIFGSLEVDGRGEFVSGDGAPLGAYQESGTYRVVTGDGILGLSDFLRERLVERLRELEKEER